MAQCQTVVPVLEPADGGQEWPVAVSEPEGLVESENTSDGCYRLGAWHTVSS